MITDNRGSEGILLSNIEKQDIIDDVMCSNLIRSSTDIGIDSAVTSQMCKKIIALSLLWMIVNFCFFGQLNLESLHLANHHNSLHQQLSKISIILTG